MKNNTHTFAVRASTLAVQGALLVMSMAAMPAFADEDPTFDELAHGKSSVEVGLTNVGKSSYKFGEYNGLGKEGVYGDVNLNLKGGGAWDSDNATRWNVSGSNLGLDTRNIQIEYGEQGKYRLNFGYDELQRNRSDSYQTPYLGSGTNNLTLPGSWKVPVVPALSGTAPNARGLSGEVANSPAGVLTGGIFPAAGPTNPSAANQASSAAIIGADLPSFHGVSLSTKRTRTDGGISYNLDRQWEFKFSVRHEDKDGLKPMSTVTRQTGGDIATIIADPIKQQTDQINASVAYTADQGFMQAAYYGSLFRNDIKTVSWQNWAAPANAMNVMSSAPDNQFHQLALTGGYNFDRNTKLVVNGSYARNTQNQGFYTDASTPYASSSSLQGLVITKAFNARLTARPQKDLNLSANYKFDERENKTPVGLYAFYDAQEAAGATNANTAFTTALGLPAGALKSNANINASRPYSKKVNQLNLDGDYSVVKGQNIKFGWDWQKIDRWCNGSWADCVDANSTKENTLRAEWRGNWMEAGVSGRIGYAYSDRKVSNYNENAFLALVPMANVTMTGQNISAQQALQLSGLNGYGPLAGYNGGAFPGTGLTAAQAAFFFPNNNALANAAYSNQNRISELPGMRRYNMADRNRDKLRTSVNWQASDQLALQGGLDFNKDDYANSTYGLKDAKSWALNVDGTYAFSEDFTGSLFYTYEDQRSSSAGNSYTANSNATALGGQTAVANGCYATVQSRNNNAKVDPCLNWSTDMKDRIDTFGIGVKHKGLMSGKLALSGDVIYTKARTDTAASGGNYVTNPYAGVAGNPTSAIAAFFVQGSDMPTVTTKTLEFRVSGRYAIDKSQAIRAGYSYSRMRSTDYAYDAMQYGGLAGVLPSGETAFNYSVQVIGVGYIYSF